MSTDQQIRVHHLERMVRFANHSGSEFGFIFERQSDLFTCHFMIYLLLETNLFEVQNNFTTSSVIPFMVANS